MATRKFTVRNVIKTYTSGMFTLFKGYNKSIFAVN